VIFAGRPIEFLARLYRLPGVKHDLEQWISSEPTGAYSRRACFFFEWLMPDQLESPGVLQANYVDALPPEDFFVGHAILNKRWRVRDNLPGNRDYCPIIRRVDAVKAAGQYNLSAKLLELEADYGIDLIMRSTVWLTVKESRASFLIEHEQNKEDRIRRFAAVTESECGKHENLFAQETLALLQRGILGDTSLRYGARKSPVYVGHSARYQPVVDYIPPHWDHLDSILAGLACFLARTQDGAPIVRAATTSFGFVYAHPMADGNGRISRFLINDVLRRDGIVLIRYFASAMQFPGDNLCVVSCCKNVDVLSQIGVSILGAGILKKSTQKVSDWPPTRTAGWGDFWSALKKAGRSLGWNQSKPALTRYPGIRTMRKSDGFTLAISFAREIASSIGNFATDSIPPPAVPLC